MCIRDRTLRDSGWETTWRHSHLASVKQGSRNTLGSNGDGNLPITSHSGQQQIYKKCFAGVTRSICLGITATQCLRQCYPWSHSRPSSASDSDLELSNQQLPHVIRELDDIIRQLPQVFTVDYNFLLSWQWWKPKLLEKAPRHGEDNIFKEDQAHTVHSCLLYTSRCV